MKVAKQNTSASIPPLFVDRDTAALLLSVSHTTIEKLVREGEFPKPRKITTRRVGWLLSELEAWAANRPVSDLLPPPNTGAKKPRG